MAHDKTEEPLTEREILLRQVLARLLRMDADQLRRVNFYIDRIER